MIKKLLNQCFTWNKNINIKEYMNISKKLIDVFNEYNIELSDEKSLKIEKFNNLMLEYNQIHNLTTLTSEFDVIYKHYLDSVLIINNIPDNCKIIDLGCGGGFPSIPLKILNESLNFTAVDSVGKKTTFVNNAKNELKLNNFDVINSRIEDLAYKNEFREKYDIVVSRALAPLSTVIEYSAPFLKNGGKIISYKGANYKEEIKNSTNAFQKLNCRLVDTVKFYIKETDTYRYFLIIEKFKDIPKNYPRKQNKPRIQPL